MPRVPVNGVELYYESHGEGPAIVLAHGVGGNHASWFYQIPVFSKSYRVITIDHRGFGLSTDPERIGRSAFVEDLKGLLAHLGIEKVALVAQSMGGGTCAGFTVAYPERVAALVMADTVAGHAETGKVKALMDEARAATNHLSQQERVLGPRIKKESPALALLYGQIASFNATNVKTITGQTKPWTAADLAATKVPILFLVGLDDVLFPPAVVRAVQKDVPGSFLVEIADTGHSAYFENHVEFNDSVLSFFQAVGYRGARRAPHSNTPGYVPVA